MGEPADRAVDCRYILIHRFRQRHMCPEGVVVATSAFAGDVVGLCDALAAAAPHLTFAAVRQEYEGDHVSRQYTPGDVIDCFTLRGVPVAWTSST